MQPRRFWRGRMSMRMSWGVRVWVLREPPAVASLPRPPFATQKGEG